MALGSCTSVASLLAGTINNTIFKSTIHAKINTWKVWFLSINMPPFDVGYISCGYGPFNIQVSFELVHILHPSSFIHLSVWTSYVQGLDLDTRTLIASFVEKKNWNSSSHGQSRWWLWIVKAYWTLSLSESGIVWAATARNKFKKRTECSRNPLARVCLCVPSHPSRACLSVECWLLILHFGGRFIQFWWVCHINIAHTHTHFAAPRMWCEEKCMRARAENKSVCAAVVSSVCTSVSTFHFYSLNFWAVRQVSSRKRHIRTTQALQMRTNK